MTDVKRGDLLLAICGVGLRIYMAVTVLTAIGITAFMAWVLVAPPQAIAAKLEAGPPHTLPVMVIGAVLVVATLVLAYLFALQLMRIIRTVKVGDPFEPANADRLTRMGWYALGATVCSWIVGGLVALVSHTIEGLDVKASPTAGLALVVTLFILARVFRHGAAMRDDLIGTV